MSKLDGVCPPSSSADSNSRTLIATLKAEFGEELVKANLSLVKERAKEVVAQQQEQQEQQQQQQQQPEDDEVLQLDDDEEGDDDGDNEVEPALVSSLIASSVFF